MSVHFLYIFEIYKTINDDKKTFSGRIIYYGHQLQ